jgi:hypothetical protein
MNTDCLTAIAEFAGPKEAMKISPFFVKKMFPSSILIRGYKQLAQFRKWAQLFDTSNLVEVRIVIEETSFYEQLMLLGDRIQTEPVPPNPERPDGYWVDGPIGWVPPSVKKLSLRVTIDIPLVFPDTLEELVIEHYYDWMTNIALPDSIRTVHLMKGFDGIIGHWPANLESVTIDHYYEGGRHPVPIGGLPGTVKHIVVGSDLNIDFLQWPESLETLEFMGEPEVFGWSLADVEIPEWVAVTVTPIEPPEPAFDYDDYEDPMVEMWYL